MEPLPRPPYKPVLIWVLILLVMVWAMAVIGAITRLTESGLSMVEWRPLIGAIPPLNTEDWQRVFSLYQQTPEYQLRNAGMELSEFKTIFFWEWFHRFWGRLIGLVALIGAVFFAIKGSLHAKNLLRFLLVFALGAGQAVMGWYMVKSGLVDQPRVSHYRLAAHFLLAIAILSALLWLAYHLVKPHRKEPSFSAVLLPGRWLFTIILVILMITLFYGALVAGLDAGLAYNSFPLMDGQFFPPGAWSIQPIWRNIFDNTGLVQFIHRWLALSCGVAILGWWVYNLWYFAQRQEKMPKWLHLPLILVIAQIGLGIATLLSQVALVPAVLHQAVALLLWLSLLGIGLVAKWSKAP